MWCDVIFLVRWIISYHIISIVHHPSSPLLGRVCCERRKLTATTTNTNTTSFVAGYRILELTPFVLINQNPWPMVHAEQKAKLPTLHQMLFSVVAAKREERPLIQLIPRYSTEYIDTPIPYHPCGSSKFSCASIPCNVVVRRAQCDLHSEEVSSSRRAEFKHLLYRETSYRADQLDLRDDLQLSFVYSIAWASSFEISQPRILEKELEIEVGCILVAKALRSTVIEPGAGAKSLGPFLSCMYIPTVKDESQCCCLDVS